jgi:hypothetical protein
MSSKLKSYAMYNESAGSGGNDLRKRVTSSRASEDDRGMTLLTKSRRIVDKESLRRTEAIESSIVKVDCYLLSMDYLLVIVCMY